MPSSAEFSISPLHGGKRVGRSLGGLSCCRASLELAQLGSVLCGPASPRWRWSALALVYVVSSWALITGGLEIAAAVKLRKEIEGEWLLALSGLLSMVLGFLLAFFPDAGAIGLVWYLGAYAVVFGILMVALGWRLRMRRTQDHSQPSQAAA